MARILDRATIYGAISPMVVPHASFSASPYMVPELSLNRASVPAMGWVQGARSTAAPA